MTNAKKCLLFVSASRTTLDLRNNNLGRVGGKALAEGLRVNASLTSLDLSGNRLCGLYDELDHRYKHTDRP